MGVGFYLFALVATALTFLTVEVLGRVEQRVIADERERPVADQAATAQREARGADALMRAPPLPDRRAPSAQPASSQASRPRTPW